MSAVDKEVPELVVLYESLGLGRADRLRRDLQQAEKFYSSADWKECLLNARNVLEGTLWDVAEAHARLSRKPLRANPGPKAVRDYLRESSLIDEDAWRLLGQAYGRKSDYLHTDGGTPTRETARLWLNEAKSLSEFVLQKFDAWVKKLPPGA